MYAQARARRRRAAVAVVAAAGLTLAACGADEADTNGDINGAQDDSPAEEATISVWHYFSEDNQVALMDAYAERFEEARDGVTVENVYVPYDQLNSNVISAVGAQEGPDVVIFNGAEWSTLALAGALAPLDEYWAEYADADQFPDGVQHGTEEDMFALQGYVNLLGLWYNADILEEIGAEPPSTIDELESVMADAADAGYEGITLSALPQSQGEWQAYPWLSSQGFDYTNLDADALADGFSMVRDWVEEGYLSQEATTWDQTVPFQQFTAGDIAFAANGNWQMAAAEADASFEYGVVPLPVGDGGQVYLGGEGQAIGAFSEHPDLAWEYLTETYLHPEGQLLAVDSVGSIPSRSDASQDPVVTDNEMLDPFSTTVAQNGATYPDSVVPPEAVADLQTAMGQAWSAAVGGQTAPEEAASQVVDELAALIQ